jgi:hypothetical protein
LALSVPPKTADRGYLPIETLGVQGKPYEPNVIIPSFLAELRAAIG